MAKPRLVNRLRLFVAGAVTTRLFGREPGVWWAEDRVRAVEYAKWLEGLDEGRQRRRVLDTMRDVSTTFAEPKPMAILTAVATALLTERTLISERLAEVMRRAENASMR